MDSRFPSCSGKARASCRARSRTGPGQPPPYQANPESGAVAAFMPYISAAPRDRLSPKPSGTERGRTQARVRGTGARPAIPYWVSTCALPTAQTASGTGLDASKATTCSTCLSQRLRLGTSCHDAHRVDSGRSVRAPIGDTEKACRLPSSLLTHPHIRGRPPGFRPCAGYRADYGARFDAAVLGVARSQVVDHGSTSLHAV